MQAPPFASLSLEKCSFTLLLATKLRLLISSVQNFPLNLMRCDMATKTEKSVDIPPRGDKNEDPISGAPGCPSG